MALFVSEADVSTAWVAALGTLLANGGDVVNLTVAIGNPTREHQGVRTVLDQFNGERRMRNRKAVELISTVANTIFPSSWYIEHLGVEAEAHLYDLERVARPVSRKRNKFGTYFERMVAWPDPKGKEFNQLDQVVQRLRTIQEAGKAKRFNASEIGISMPGDEAIAVPIFVGGKDRQVRGFPCLSHLSFSLNKGVVHLSAIYRSHDFISRAYGNYLGLGRVLSFVAQQSGFPAGELTCLSSSATAEIGKAGVGKRSLEDLLQDCRRALKAAP